MHNHWGGSLEINGGESSTIDDEKSRNTDWDRASISHRTYQNNQLDETQQSWLLGPSDKKKKKYVDLGCVVCSRTALKWTLWSILIAFVVIGLPIIIAKSLPKHKHPIPPPDNYTLALHKALLFFNAQKCKFFYSFIYFYYYCQIRFPIIYLTFTICLTLCVNVIDVDCIFKIFFFCILV